MQLTLALATVALLLGPTAVSAGQWERVDALPAGRSITVVLKSGERVDGTVSRSDSANLTLAAALRDERIIPKAEVRQILAEKKDSALDGLLRGAAIGAGIGVMVGYDRRTFECRAGCSIAIGTTLFTPAGALIGWLRDRKRPQIEVVYEAD